MKIAGLLEEDFVNYKKPCMTVMFPKCSFKCNKECGREVCHNSYLKDEEMIDIAASDIVERYISNPISESIVMQGLEPFDTFDDLFSLIYKFTEKSNDDIVIYTGYKEDEIEYQLSDLMNIIEGNHLIVKFGRFIPNSQSVLDPVLGVKLMSDNQYAKQLL